MHGPGPDLRADFEAFLNHHYRDYLMVLMAIGAPDDSQPEAVGKAFADYLGLVEETIKTQVTGGDIKARIHRAMVVAVRESPRARLQQLEGRAGDRHSWGATELRSRRMLLDALVALTHKPLQGPAVLAGPCGTGKTTVAAALARRAQAQGDQVWWVSAADPVTLLRDLKAVAQQLGGVGAVEAIGALPEADAARMLLELAPSAGDEDQANALARRLDGHPLSLRLAGSYLHSRAAQGATFAAYERALGEQVEGSYGSGHQAAVPAEALTARALKLSLDGLAQQEIPQTRPVLQLASWWHTAATCAWPRPCTGITSGPGCGCSDLGIETS